jgi:hypothetical protein
MADELVMANTENGVPRSADREPTQAADHPLSTVHGTLDRAIVVPPMGNVVPRAAATDPAPTQTTTTRASLVEPKEAA